MLETLFFRVLWTYGPKWESVSTYSFMNVHMYKRVQFIELVKAIKFLISVWDEKEEEGCMTQFIGI